MTPGTSVGFYVGGEDCCGNFFNGEVKSLRVWKRVLTQEEITTNFETEHGKHDSATVRFLTCMGNLKRIFLKNTQFGKI